jgi:uncharacterized protein YjbI with pentapeptide repeats
MARTPPASGAPVPEGPRAPRLPAELNAPAEQVALDDDAEWEGDDVRGVDLSGAAARRVDLRESRLTSVRLVGAQLERLLATDCVLDDCDLSGAILEEAALTRVGLVRCRMTGVVLAGARLEDVRFVECRVDEANLRMITGDRVAFERCMLTGADFYDARLSAARFSECDLRGSEFSKADVRGARFHGSDVSGLRGAAHLKGAHIDGAQILPLAVQVFAAMGITVEGEDEGTDEPDA